MSSIKRDEEEDEGKNDGKWGEFMSFAKGNPEQAINFIPSPQTIDAPFSVHLDEENKKNSSRRPMSSYVNDEKVLMRGSNAF